MLPFDDETVVPHAAWMRKALDQAMQAFDQDEVPVGAVIVYEGRVIGEGYNQRETLQDPTAHIGHGSSVTYSVQSRSRHEPSS